MVVRILLMVLAAFAVLYGCDQASPPAERQERDAGVEGPGSSSPPASEPAAPSAGGTPVGGAFARAELRPIGDSGVSGEAVFKEVGSLGVQVDLSASGLPPGEPYFAQAHEGDCSEAPRGDGRGPEDDHHGDDHHHGEEHEHGAGVTSLALVRLGWFLDAATEYADHGEFEPPPDDGLPGNADQPAELASSADGTAAVTTLLEGVAPGRITSGVPKYIDVRSPNEGPPEDWPALACADLAQGD
jgi:hypothetical protein